MYWTNYLGSFVRMEGVHVTLNWDIVEDRRLKFGKMDNLKNRPNFKMFFLKYTVVSSINLRLDSLLVHHIELQIISSLRIHPRASLNLSSFKK